jgi:hypothetical protein
MINEQFKAVPVMNYADISSTVHSKGINMRDYHKCTFLIMCNALGGATATLTVTSGAAATSYTSPLTFNSAWGGAAEGSAASDVLAAWVNGASVALTYTIYSGFMLIVEVKAEDMDMVNSENWLGFTITTAGSVTGRVSAFAVLEPRFKNNRSATALA